MPRCWQPPGSGDPCLLLASLDNARHLSGLLRAVHFQDHATCFATANGLRVTVEDAKCIQANAFIQVRAAPWALAWPGAGAAAGGGLRGEGGVRQLCWRRWGSVAEMPAEGWEVT